MLLAVNIGNTRLTVGVFAQEKLCFSAQLATVATATADEYAIKLSALLSLHGLAPEQLQGAVLSSVVPVLTQPLRRAMGDLCHARVMLVGPGLRSGLPILIDDPAQLGGELLCCTVAALEKAEPPLLMIHADTAISIMAVDAQHRLAGGVILPGPDVSLGALVQCTAQLPQVDLTADAPTVMATNTRACLQAGTILGTAALLDGLVTRFAAELGGPPAVVVTGALPPAVRRACRTPMQYEETLLLEGLRQIWQRNRR